VAGGRICVHCPLEFVAEGIARFTVRSVAVFLKIPAVMLHKLVHPVLHKAQRVPSILHAPLHCARPVGATAGLGACRPKLGVGPKDAASALSRANDNSVIS
jgi:hypothetical protein